MNTNLMPEHTAVSEREFSPDISMFLASSVHDMKNSISILIGGLEQVLEQVSQESFPAYQDVTHMVYESKRINSNLIQLLTLYKIGQHILRHQVAVSACTSFYSSLSAVRP
jgi:signal transduction histidine kinase